MEVSILIRLKVSQCSLLMRRIYSSMRFSSTKSCSSSAKRTYSQSSLNFTRNLKVLSSSKCPVEKVHFLAEFALYLCEVGGLAGQFVNQLHTSLGGLYGLCGFRMEYILMRLVPVVCRNLTVGFQVLLQFPYIFFRFFQFFVRRSIFSAGKMFPLSAFPVPAGADVSVRRVPVAIRGYGLSSPVYLSDIR